MIHSVLAQEGDQPVHQCQGLLALRLVEEEHMLLADGLQPLHRTAPTALLHRLVVRRGPCPRVVISLGRANKQLPAYQVLQARRSSAMGFNLGSSRPSVLPGLISSQSFSVISLVSLDSPSIGSFPENIGCSRIAPARDPGRQTTASTCHDRYVVNDVGASAVAGQEDTAGVAVAGQPRIGGPAERCLRVVVGRWKRVLRGETVVDRHR